MSVSQILALCRQHAIQLKVDGEKLTLVAQHQAIDEQLVSLIRRHKAQLIELLSPQVSTAGPVLKALPEERRYELQPASFNQQRLWFLHQLGDRAAYNGGIALELEGVLDSGALLEAIRALILRHESLRTSFVDKDGVPWQRVTKAAAPVCEEFRLDASSDIESALTDAVSEELDLTADVLLRVRLFVLEAGRCIVLFVTHHITADAWSQEILVKDFCELYNAAAEKRSATLSAPALQYIDYAVWERARLRGSLLADKLAAWRKYLADVPPIHGLPCDLPRPRRPGRRLGSLHQPVAGAIVDALSHIAGERQTSLFCVFAAAYVALLSRLSDSDDIVLGMPVANRQHPELQHTCGFFSNTMVLRSRLSEALSFHDLIDRCKANLQFVLAHQDLPFDVLVDDLKIGRSLGMVPLYQLWFSWHERTPETYELIGLSARARPVERSVSRYDLKLEMVKERGRVSARWEFDSNLFEPETIQRFATHFEALLQRLAKDPSCRLKDIELDSPQTVRMAYAQAPQSAQNDLLGPWLLRAGNEPEACAVISDDRSIGYALVHERSNRLVALLTEFGIASGARVGVVCPQSVEALVALLAIWKAGAVYVPIDPQTSEKNVRYIASEAGIKLILATPISAQALTLEGIELVLLEDVCSEQWLVDFADRPPAAQIRGIDAEVYVSYSDSNSQSPRGVSLTSENLAEYARGLAAEHDFPLGMRYAWSSPPGTLEGDSLLFLSVCLAGTLRVVTEELASQPELLYALLKQDAVDCVKLSAGALQVLCREPDAVVPRKYVLTPCEDMSPALLKDIGEAGVLQNCRVILEYGRAETSLSCLTLPCSTKESHRIVPAGRPLGRNRALVMQGRVKVPPGAWGELVIAGPCVASRYIGNSGKDTGFSQLTFDDGTTLRSYRTGMRARVDTHGNLILGGPIGDSLATRAIRADFSESEFALRELPSVRAAVVTLDASGDLLACVVSSSTSHELREQLAAILPAYLLPKAIFVVPKLPLDRRGKLDWAASGATLVRPASEHRNAESEVERALASMWCELLGREHIAATDHFFESGGHSLLATRLLNRIRAQLRAQIDLAAIFQHPILADLARHIDRLIAQRQDTPAERLPPIVRRAEPSACLSYAQQQMWLIDRIEQGSAHYNMVAVYCFQGELDRDALVRGLQGLIKRHSALRTRFLESDGQVRQIISDAWTLPVTIEDLTHLEEPERSQALARLVDKESSFRFDLSAGMPVRATVAVLAARETVMVLNVHHIVCDGWSVSLLIQELKVFYEAALRGVATELPELPIRYTDYAQWQREYLDGERLHAQLSFWRELAQGAAPLHEIPLDRPRPPFLQHAGGEVVAHLEAKKLQALKRLALSSHTTLFICLESLFALFIARLSGRDDVIVGTPVSGRWHKDVEPLVGLFVNTIPLRHTVSGDATLPAYLARSHAVVSAALANQHCPFELLVDRLNVERSLAYNPIFQIVFALKDEAAKQIELPGVVVQRIERQHVESKFDLMLSAVNTGQGLRLEWQYATALFECQTIELVSAQFVAFIDSVLQAPAVRVAEISLLCERDRQILANDAQALNSVGRDLHSLFIECAAANRHATAVEEGERRLTYGELAESAGQVAAHLLERGIQPGDRVGLYLPRGVDFVRCMLGIVQIGATYVPLDTSYPAARLQFIARDAGLSFVISTRELFGDLQTVAARLICVSELDGAAGIACAPVELSPETVAYLMYTSGSSGVPKGVIVPHRAIVRLVRNCSFMQIDARTVMLHLAPVAFDASTLEIWGPLLNGGRIAIYPHADVELDRLTGFLASHDVNAMWLTSVLFEQWGAQLSEPLRALRQVITGGDVVSPFAVRRLYDLLPDVEIINGYGPTENTTFTCCYSIPRGWPANRPVPIGYPISGTAIRVLDGAGRDRPLGTVGELYACGEGLALGYWRNDALTREKFVRDAHSGQLMYRTGDLVRRSRDGALQFLGRVDDQVKIRGYRVELGEIERCLMAQPGVKEVAVSIIGEDKQLVAYFTRAANAAESGSALREALRQRVADELPVFMVPVAFVELGALPIGPNGKLDRSALPLPAKGDYASGDYVPPEGELEQALAQIWSRLLGFERIGAFDNFFSLGGNSLLATRMASALQERTGLKLPLREVYQRGSIRELSRWLADRSVAHDDAAIHLVARGGPLLASYAQQRLWFIDRMGGGSVQYNMPALFDLRGRLDRGALQTALDRLIERHEILRTTYAELHGSAVQMASPRGAQPIRYYDLRETPWKERHAAAEHLLESEARTAFDLRSGPVFRVTLARLGADEYRLLLNMHHIAADGWSVGVLMRDLMSLYVAESQRTQPSLPVLPVQYADYAQWQRAQLSRERRESLLSYWREQLRDLPPLHGLPTDRPRPPRMTTKGADFRTCLDRTLTTKLTRLANSRGVSLFAVLQAVYSLLLCRISGERDIVFGTPVAGRERSELEHLVGCFVNTLVLRNRIPAHASFLDFLAQSHSMVLDAMEHQVLPFDMLVEDLNPPRSASHLPLMQLWFVLQNMELVDLALPGVQVRELERKEVSVKFDLMLSATEKSGGIELHWVYNADLFDAESIRSWAESFGVLVGSVVEQPAADIATLPVLSAAQRTRLDRYAVDARLNIPRTTLLSRFRRAALENPQSVAIRCGEHALTYGQLTSCVERLAGYLRELGIAAGDIVGVCCERSVEQLIAVLGIWQAGAAFVPLDSRAPRERLSFIVGETGAKLLLVSQSAADLFDLSKVDLLVLDGAGSNESWLIEFANTADFSNEDALAYVLYTSGTTGRPKGVMVGHRSLTHLEVGLHRLLSSSGCKLPLRWAWNAPLVFDASLQALTQLSLGGELHLLSEEARANPQALLAYLRKHEIELLDCTPSLLELLLLEAGRRDSPLPHLLVGGEPIHDKQWNDIAARMEKSGRVAINVYGPTETTVDATWAVIRSSAPPSIGRPLPNVEIRVLDENLLELPVGALGECCIGGPGVARGYLARPELSAEKFVHVPHRSDGDVYYRSGDLVRWMSNGELMYLRRRDTQIKLRGYRVELTEIEQTILAVPGMTAAAVAVAPGGGTLIAYFVSTAPDSGNSEIEDRCRRLLPEYMVPSAFVRLEKIPLTANGKLDVKALPVPLSTPEARRLSASSTTERRLQVIWQRLLGRALVGVNSNFFVAGGHSLLAIRVVSAVREEMGVELPLAALFKQPTISELAKTIDSLERKRRFAPLEPADRATKLPLSFSQYRLWLIDRMEGGSPQYNMPAAYNFHGTLDVAACRSSVEFIVARHEVLRTSYRESEGQPVQIVHGQVAVPFLVTDLTHVSSSELEEAVREAVHADASRPFDLTGEVMLRVELLKLAEDRHVLIFNMHHIASDGWSITLLIREFIAAYEAFAAGRPLTLKPLAIQYADFAAWQRKVLTASAIESDLSYWRERLRGVPQVHSLPLDKPRPVRQTYNGASIVRRLPPGMVGALKGLSTRADVTLFVTLQTAMAALLARWSNEDDIIIGTPVAGRDEESLEPLIGFFLNTLVIRNDLSGNPTFRELLERTRRTVLSAFEHRNVPFEVMLDSLRPERSLSHLPVFQVMFVLQNQEQAELRLPGLTMTPFERPLVVAKFDLLLNARESHEGIELYWTYNSDLFTPDMVERMADGFEQLILNAVKDWNTRLAALNLLPAAEAHKIVVRWNDTQADLPYNQCLHELFIRQVQKMPDRVALIDAEGSLSYAELFSRAYSLSEALRPHLEEPESLAGVLLPKGRGQLIATLGIMMSGGAYLPLDVHWPKARIDQILAHGQARALISFKDAAEGLQHEAARVFLEEIAEPQALDARVACAAFRPVQSPESLAYVIFTSGSTGTPKGVAIDHRSAVNTLLDINQRYAVTEADSVLAVSALSFDLSVYDLFGLLAAGGCVVFPDDRLQRDPAHWADLVERHRISLWDTVPACAELLTSHYECGQRRSDSCLRIVMMSGDWIPPALPKRIWSVFGAVEIHSLGGATEGSIWSISYPITTDMSGRKSVPYGRPLANQSFYVLSDDLQPCPVGVAGQLYIGGIGVARDYYRDPERTAASFIQHPVFGTRLYRTGDIGRYFADGNVEFIGRKDQQVKIRGFRIELGEIEAAIGSHSAVEDAVVLALRDPGNVQQLVAYLTLADGASDGKLVTAQLRSKLSSALPDYMVPSHYIVLDAFPFSANQKIDRKRLPEPEWREEEGGIAEPRSHSERLLLKLWQEVMGREKLRIDRNFFEAGGTSVHLIEIASRANKLLRQDIGVVSFFEHPTIESMARFIDERARAAALTTAGVKREKSRLSELRARRK